MIILPIILATLLIPPTITKTLVWNKCENEFVCTCTSDVSKKISHFVPDPADLTLDCKHGVQQKYINEQSALFLLEATELKLDAASNKQLGLYQDDKIIFGCEFGRERKDVTLTGIPDLRKTFKIALFEDKSSCDLVSGSCLCAVKVTKMIQMAPQLKVSHPGPGMKQMKFIQNDVPTVYDFNSVTASDVIFGKHTITMRCDPYIFKEKSSLDGFRVLPLKHSKSIIDQMDLECDHGPSYKMKYEFKDQIDGLDKLECRKDLTDFSYNYYLHKDGNEAKLEQENLDKYAFFCAANIAEMCENPKKDCTAGPTCPKYEKGSPKVPATLKCPENKWIVGGEYLVLEKDPICTADDDLNSNNAVFRMITPSGSEKKMDEATMRTTSCFQHYDCNVTNLIQLDESLESSNGVVKCKDDHKTMEVHMYEKNETFLYTKSFKCNNDTGSWINATGSTEEIIPGGSFVTCPKDKKEYEEQAGQVGLSGGAQAGIILGVLVLVIAVAAACIYAFYRYANRAYKPKEKKQFMKLSKDELIKHCREFFPEALLCSTNSSMHITAGLVELDALFDVGIDDLDVWEVVYPFLMRIHGTIDRIDEGILFMFSRYLYLQAKKIIDKHGWISPTPIRKNNPKDGIIRMVAIHLLSMARLNRRHYDAEKLIQTGFRKLGFKGRKQYPHCGVMWSVVAHSRPGLKNKKKDNTERREFDPINFESKLRRLLFRKKESMPADEIIPAFGTVQQQAAFALGAWTYLNSDEIIEKQDDGGKVTLSYLDGMACSTNRTPGEFLLQVGGMWIHPKPEWLEGLWTTVPRKECDKIIEKAFKISMYYGRYLDATKLDERYMSDKPKPNREIVKMQIEQEDFEEALEQQLEELREWYGAHTDQAELKHKPVYKTSEQYKQDHRFHKKQALPEPAAAPDSPLPAAKSNTGSAKSSASGSSTTDQNKAPPAAAAPAQAAAAAAPAAAPAQAAAAAAPAAPPPPSA